VNYLEAANDPVTPWDEGNFNDGPNNNPTRGEELAGDSNPPGAIRSGDDIGLNNSDVLVIKSTNIATSDAASKWTYAMGTAGGGNTVNIWGSSVDDLNNGERVIVIIPLRGEDNQRILVTDPAFNFSVQFNDAGLPAAYVPSTVGDNYLIYGVDPNTDLRMPFNRADFYVRMPANMPPRCAVNTGILYKGIVNQADGLLNEIRLVECVADMQVIYRLDIDGNEVIETQTDNINLLPSFEIRERLKEVRVYILAQEGQKDQGYNFSGFTGICGTCMEVGQWGLGSDFDLAAAIPDYLEYRWKVYTLVVKPANLRES
jgi:hypothetical protein